MCICSITPRIDYGQGNTWDTYLKTMNDWHKPALDGIGYQDSLNGERAWWTDYLSDKPSLTRTSAGKTGIVTGNRSEERRVGKEC